MPRRKKSEPQPIDLNQIVDLSATEHGITTSSGLPVQYIHFKVARNIVTGKLIFKNGDVQNTDIEIVNSNKMEMTLRTLTYILEYADLYVSAKELVKDKTGKADPFGNSKQVVITLKHKIVVSAQ